MNLLNYLKQIFGIYPKGPNEFVKKFINDSRKSRLQLEMIYNQNIILQVDSLKFTPSWFGIIDKDLKKYKNGFVVFFIIDKKDIDKSKIYKNYLNSNNLKMIEIEEVHGKTEILTFAHFLDKNVDYLVLSKYMRLVIDSVYKLPEQNPQILFNLRYLKRYH